MTSELAKVTPKWPQDTSDDPKMTPKGPQDDLRVGQDGHKIRLCASFQSLQWKSSWRHLQDLEKSFEKCAKGFLEHEKSCKTLFKSLSKTCERPCDGLGTIFGVHMFHCCAGPPQNPFLKAFTSPWTVLWKARKRPFKDMRKLVKGLFKAFQKLVVKGLVMVLELFSVFICFIASSPDPPKFLHKSTELLLAPRNLQEHLVVPGKSSELLRTLHDHVVSPAQTFW